MGLPPAIPSSSKSWMIMSIETTMVTWGFRIFMYFLEPQICHTWNNYGYPLSSPKSAFWRLASRSASRSVRITSKDDGPNWVTAVVQVIRAISLAFFSLKHCLHIHSWWHAPVLTCSSFHISLHRLSNFLGHTRWAPTVISWFINPINYSYKYHKP